MKFLNKAAAQHFRGWKTVKLSEPVPPHAYLRRWSSPDSTRDMTLQQRDRLVLLTARSGVLANLQTAFAAAGRSPNYDVLRAAAASGSQEVCQWFLDMGHLRDGLDYEWALQAAAAAGHLQLVRWLLQLSAMVREKSVTIAFNGAAAGGQQALCEGLLADGAQWTTDTLSVALQFGHGALVEWLLELHQPPTGEPGDVPWFLLFHAARRADLPLLQRVCRFYLGSRPLVEFEDKALMAGAVISPTSDWRDKVAWLGQQGMSLTLEEAEVAELPGHWVNFLRLLPELPDAVERLQLLQQRGWLVEEDYELLDKGAIETSCVPVLRYLREHNLLEEREPRYSSMAAAAGKGDVGLMSELQMLGDQLTSAAAKRAAKSGHLHVLQWMAGPEAGPEGEAALLAAQPSLTSSAAMSGSVAVVRWARERGCPWADDTFKGAASSGNTALLEMLAAEGCPMQVRAYEA